MYIHINSEKKLDKQYSIYGSLPIMCESEGLDYKIFQKHFRSNPVVNKKTKKEYNNCNTFYENKNIQIVKTNLKRGGK